MVQASRCVYIALLFKNNKEMIMYKEEKYIPLYPYVSAPYIPVPGSQDLLSLDNDKIDNMEEISLPKIRKEVLRERLESRDVLSRAVSW